MKGFSVLLLAVAAAASGGVVAWRNLDVDGRETTAGGIALATSHVASVSSRPDAPSSDWQPVASLAALRGTAQTGLRGAATPVGTTAAPAVSRDEISSFDSGAPSFSFAPYTVFPIAGGLADAVAIGDVNGDGLDDAVVANVDWFDEPDSRKVLIYLQQQNGTLAEPIKVSYAAGYVTRVGIALADLNRDGIKDIVLAYGDVVVAMGSRSAQYTFKLTPMPASVQLVASMDVDRDGNADVIAQTWSNGAYVLFGNGSGGFSRRVFMDTAAQGYNDMKVGDVTGDGLPDLVMVSGQGLQRFYVYPHDGVKGFGPVQIHAMPDDNNYWPLGGIAVGDFDADGLNDVAVTIAKNNPAYVYVYRQEADGSLARTPTYFSSYDIPEAAIAVDLDNDGHDDLVTVHGGWLAVGYYMSSRDGLSIEEQVPVPYATHYESDGLAAGDLNGDGCQDVALADYNHGLVVLYGAGCGKRPHTLSGPSGARSHLAPL